MKYFFLMVLLLSLKSLFSQAISGNVYDSKTGEVVQGASVYFANTTIGTITNDEGYFSIDPKFNSNSYLVVTHIGYKTVTIDYKDLNQDLKVQMNEEFFEIPEVVLVSDPFSRKQKLEVFRLEFLGDSEGGKKSRILNEDDLELFFNSKTNTLLVHSNKPIEIVNDHLGYQIKFDLIDFQIVFRRQSLERIDNIKWTVIYGHSFFDDIASSNERFINRRNEAYLGSIQHFIRTIWNHSWANESFEFYNKLKKVEVSKVFTVSAGTDISLKRVFFKFKKMNITYKKGPFKHWSSMNLLSGNTITIDKYGSYTPYLQLKFGGEMADDRVGDLLPIDFEENKIID